MTNIKIAVMGAGGRMGRALTKAVYKSNDCIIIGGIESVNSKFIGQDIGILAGIGNINIKITTDILKLFKKVDAILDFTIPSATISFTKLTSKMKITHVIGTTGFSDNQELLIKSAANHTTIIKSGNMSLGVNLLSALVKKTASILDEDFDIEILEIHHRNKIDAPSGTALLLGESAATGRKIKLKERSIYNHCNTLGKRPKGDIGFSTLRCGAVIGEHNVIFSGVDESIKLTHIANNRSIFANGALKAAIWGSSLNKNKLIKYKPGLYSMLDVLGIN